MIRRDDGHDWLLIPQIEHAHLAGELASLWGNVRVSPATNSAELLAAIRHHDDGWREWDAAPGVDPATGRPRSFLEMPMHVATEIWRRSIDVCSRCNASWLDAVRSADDLKSSAAPPEVRDRVLEAIARLNRPFVPSDVNDEVVAHSPGNGNVPLKEAAYKLIMQLELGGWLRKVGEEEPESHFELAFPFDPPSPFGAIAVSKHFCWLAEQALATRGDEREEIAAIEQFLESQRHEQRVLCDVARQTTGLSQSEIDATNEFGFHCVQFFDRLSLWLCMAPQREPITLESPKLGTFHLTPVAGHEVAIDPFPLLIDDSSPVTVSVTAKRLPVRRYADNDNLLTVLHKSPAERLTWKIVRPSRAVS